MSLGVLYRVGLTLSSKGKLRNKIVSDLLGTRSSSWGTRSSKGVLDRVPWVLDRVAGFTGSFLGFC